MTELDNNLLPNRNQFASDPLGYSAFAWHKWGLAQTVAGFPKDISKPPEKDDLKSPVLWLTHAHAIAEAARVVLQNEPMLDHLPLFVKGVCDSQYCAVGLMLVGYSLEVCLKSMLIISKGTDTYTAEEKQYKHHKLERLAEFLPDLNEKDKAILRALTHFVEWAGRYPDPGSGRESNSEEIFEISEKYEVSAHDLFKLAARVMGHAKRFTES